LRGRQAIDNWGQLTNHALVQHAASFTVRRQTNTRHVRQIEVMSALQCVFTHNNSTPSGFKTILYCHGNEHFSLVRLFAVLHCNQGSFFAGHVGVDMVTPIGILFLLVFENLFGIGFLNFIYCYWVLDSMHCWVVLHVYMCAL
jgi:hypothetical protein